MSIGIHTKLLLTPNPQFLFRKNIYYIYLKYSIVIPKYKKELTFMVRSTNG